MTKQQFLQYMQKKHYNEVMFAYHLETSINKLTKGEFNTKLNLLDKLSMMGVFDTTGFLDFVIHHYFVKFEITSVFTKSDNKGNRTLIKIT